MTVVTSGGGHEVVDLVDVVLTVFEVVVVDIFEVNFIFVEEDFCVVVTLVVGIGVVVVGLGVVDFEVVGGSVVIVVGYVTVWSVNIAVVLTGV